VVEDDGGAAVEDDGGAAVEDDGCGVVGAVSGEYASCIL